MSYVSLQFLLYVQKVYLTQVGDSDWEETIAKQKLCLAFKNLNNPSQNFWFLWYLSANSSNKGPADTYLQIATELVGISGLPN